jgi:hypothetical protein
MVPSFGVVDDAAASFDLRDDLVDMLPSVAASHRFSPR